MTYVHTRRMSNGKRECRRKRQQELKERAGSHPHNFITQTKAITLKPNKTQRHPALAYYFSVQCHFITLTKMPTAFYFLCTSTPPVKAQPERRFRCCRCCISCCWLLSLPILPYCHLCCYRFYYCFCSCWQFTRATIKMKILTHMHTQQPRAHTCARVMIYMLLCV